MYHVYVSEASDLYEVSEPYDDAWEASAVYAHDDEPSRMTIPYLQWQHRVYTTTFSYIHSE